MLPYKLRWGGFEEEKKAMKAWAAELSLQLAQARLRVQDLERLTEVRVEADSQLNELDLELNLALHRAKEAEA
ncbi:hypothetical protein BHM03_00020501 [Ensete ventricosum]|nr:hypothetical protein BHM03_00020501 [Ensete ventricosum]